MRYNEAARTYRQAIVDHVRNKEEAVINSNNLGKFFNLANHKFASKSGIGPLQSVNGVYCTDPAEKAAILGDFFSSVFTEDDNSMPNPVVNSSLFPDGLNNIVFDRMRVLKVMNKLKVGSAGGPDNLKPGFLKSLANELSGPLAHIFEFLFQSGCVPSSWKLAHITPVFKKGDSSLASNYRPVPLTSVCCKLMESVIKDQMMDYLLKMKFISRHQHGFLMKHSTCTQLLECVQDWSVTLKNKHSMDALYVDYSRAFDSVVHSKLLNKHLQFGIHDALFRWIESFLAKQESMCGCREQLF